ncbi:MAG: hypothetical protein U5M50_11095 [Sphingobium sp.]|nr:hypothetical protein [Sphingobium sp.]
MRNISSDKPAMLREVLVMDERTIHIRECAFGGRWIVAFEPRSIASPSLEFRSYGEAQARAHARMCGHGWPIVDETGGAHG